MSQEDLTWTEAVAQAIVVQASAIRDASVSPNLVIRSVHDTFPSTVFPLFAILISILILSIVVALVDLVRSAFRRRLSPFDLNLVKRASHDEEDAGHGWNKKKKFRTLIVPRPRTIWALAVVVAGAFQLGIIVTWMQCGQLASALQDLEILSTFAFATLALGSFLCIHSSLNSLPRLSLQGRRHCMSCSTAAEKTLIQLSRPVLHPYLSNAILLVFPVLILCAAFIFLGLSTAPLQDLDSQIASLLSAFQIGGANNITNQTFASLGQSNYSDFAQSISAALDKATGSEGRWELGVGRASVALLLVLLVVTIELLAGRRLSALIRQAEEATETAARLSADLSEAGTPGLSILTPVLGAGRAGSMASVLSYPNASANGYASRLRSQTQLRSMDLEPSPTSSSGHSSYTLPSTTSGSDAESWPDDIPLVRNGRYFGYDDSEAGSLAGGQVPCYPAAAFLVKKEKTPRSIGASRRPTSDSYTMKPSRHYLRREHGSVYGGSMLRSSTLAKTDSYGSTLSYSTDSSASSTSSRTSNYKGPSVTCLKAIQRGRLMDAALVTIGLTISALLMGITTLFAGRIAGSQTLTIANIVAMSMLETVPPLAALIFLMCRESDSEQTGSMIAHKIPLGRGEKALTVDLGHGLPTLSKNAW